MMRAILRVAGLLLVSGVALASPVPSLNPVDGVILSEAVAMSLLDQCSRTAPQHVQATWLPSAAQITELEARLPAALDIATATRRNNDKPYSFQRQYVGFIIAGRKIIYVNAFPASAARPSPNVDPSRNAFDWHKDPVMVCDGGASFFGVEYDPQSKTFAHFAFNGIA